MFFVARAGQTLGAADVGLHPLVLHPGLGELMAADVGGVRTPALSILILSLYTALRGPAQTPLPLGSFRFFTGTETAGATGFALLSILAMASGRHTLRQIAEVSGRRTAPD